MLHGGSGEGDGEGDGEGEEAGGYVTIQTKTCCSREIFDVKACNILPRLLSSRCVPMPTLSNMALTCSERL